MRERREGSSLGVADCKTGEVPAEAALGGEDS